MRGDVEVVMPYRFKCSKCDDWHEGFPDVGFDRPLYAAEVPEDERAARVFLNSDFCVVDNEHFFIRCVLLLPVRGLDETFGWGVWSTLSEKNFVRYQEAHLQDISDWDPMFGYLSNRLPDYPDTLSLKLSVQTRTADLRPTVTLEPTDHPLAIEQRDGIALEDVLRIVQPFLAH